MSIRAGIGVLAIVTAGVVATPAFAVDLGLGVRAGTYGVGADFGVGFNRWLGVRAGGSFLDVSGDYEDTGIDYDGDLELGGYGVYADVYPFKGGFRLSAGMLNNRNAIELEAVATEPQEIGDNTYTPGQIGTLSGDIEFDDSAPYFGIGWGRFTGGKRWGFLFDLGVVSQGSGEVVVTSSTGLVPQSDLDAETQEIEDDLEDYDLWPVVSFGFAWRF